MIVNRNKCTLFPINLCQVHLIKIPVEEISGGRQSDRRVVSQPIKIMPPPAAGTLVNNKNPKTNSLNVSMRHVNNW